MPYVFNVFESTGRIPGGFIAYIIDNLLPQIFNLHPNDFRIGPGAYIVAFMFLFMVVVTAKSFFINAKDNKPFYKRPESLLIIPFCFLALKIPLCYLSKNVFFPLTFSIIDLHVMFGEYYWSIVPLFLGFIALYKIYVKSEELTKKQKIFYSIVFFFIAFWNELIHSITIFSIIFLSFLFKQRTKEIFSKNKELIISFLFGIVLFYTFSDYFTGQTIATYDYNLKDYLAKIPENYSDFICQYFKYVLITKAFLILPILLLLNRKIKEISSFVLSVLFSVWITFSLSIFMIGMGYEKYLFQRETFDIIYTDILIFLLLILLGNIFYKENYKRLKVFFFIAFFLTVNIGLALFTFQNYFKDVEYAKLNKIVHFELENRSIIYGLFDEIVILPESYVDLIFINPPYFNREDAFGKVLGKAGFATVFIDKYYSLDIKGYVFKSDETAKNELEKRMELFKELNDINKIDILNDKRAFTKMRDAYKSIKREDNETIRNYIGLRDR